MGLLESLIANGYDVDLERRRVKVEKTGVRYAGATASLGERVVATCPAAYGCADAYAAFHADPAAVGATVRLYAITGTAKVLVASGVVASSSSPMLLAAAGRSCDSWELSIQPAVGVPNQAQDWDFFLVSHDSPTTSASLIVINGGASGGAASFSRIRGSSGVVKAAAGNLLQIYANYDTAGGAGTRWLMIFDAAALPANGTAPTLAAIPLVGVDTIASLDVTNSSDPPSSPGKPMATGIVWAISSTKNTLTLDAASTFDVETKFL